MVYSNRVCTFKVLVLVVIAAAIGANGEINTVRLTLGQVIAGLKKGTFTSEELTLAYQKQIEKWEPYYNAFTYLNPDALAEAKAADEKRKATGGKGLPILFGVPIVIKEAMDHVGWPSTWGWTKLASATNGTEVFPLENATLVQRLLDAGAIILGKSNIPAFSADGSRANSSWAGPTFNAVNRLLVPGASSSGSATAVSAGMCAWAMAEETGGSIQNPAASQSLVGIKTTFGLIPTKGVVPLAGLTRDVVGPLARTVRDAAIAMDALVAEGLAPIGGYTADLGKVTLKGKRLGLFGSGWRDQALAPLTKVLYAKAQRELKGLGAILVRDPFAGTGFNKLADTSQGFDSRGLESIVYDFDQYLKGLGIESLDALKALIGVSPFDKGQPLAFALNTVGVKESLKDPSKKPDLSSFAALRAVHLKIIGEVFCKFKLDALVFPQAAEPYPELDGTDSVQALTVSEINIAGIPGVTVPSVSIPRKNGPAPFNLIFVGPAFSEAKLLALAYDYERATRHRLGPTLTKK